MAANSDGGSAMTGIANKATGRTIMGGMMRTTPEPTGTMMMTLATTAAAARDTTEGVLG